MITVSKVVEFIQDAGVCKDWTEQQLRVGIISAVYNNALGFEIDQEDNILSFCFGRWESENTFHVIAMIGKGKLESMMRHLKLNFPQCKYLTAGRKNKRQMKLSVDSLCKKLKIYGNS